MKPSNRYISQVEAGAALGLARPAVRALMDHGNLPIETSGGVRRIVRSEFKRLYPTAPEVKADKAEHSTIAGPASPISLDDLDRGDCRDRAMPATI